MFIQNLKAFYKYLNFLWDCLFSICYIFNRLYVNTINQQGDLPNECGTIWSASFYFTGEFH